MAAVERPDRLRRLLAALAGEDVVVVANGATDAVRAVIDAAGVRCVRLEPNRGPAAARNAGWRACEADYVAFTDDDCLPAPGWLDALRAAAAPGAVVQGRVAPLPEEAELVGPFARTVVVSAQSPFFHTANVLYPRAVLEAVGGFDEGYNRVAGEDTDLGWRAVEAGCSVRFAPDALVWHAVTVPGWRGLARDAARWGTAVQLVKRHPGLRAHFHHRIFWKRSHEHLLLALAGLSGQSLLSTRSGLRGQSLLSTRSGLRGQSLLSTRSGLRGLSLLSARSGLRGQSLLSARSGLRGLTLLSAVPWLVVHRTEHPSKASLMRALPAHLVVDAAEIVALARGSARARTLLL